MSLSLYHHHNVGHPLFAFSITLSQPGLLSQITSTDNFIHTLLTPSKPSHIDNQTTFQHNNNEQPPTHTETQNKKQEMEQNQDESLLVLFIVVSGILGVFGFLWMDSETRCENRRLAASNDALD